MHRHLVGSVRRWLHHVRACHDGEPAEELASPRLDSSTARPRRRPITSAIRLKRTLPSETDRRRAIAARFPPAILNRKTFRSIGPADFGRLMRHIPPLPIFMNVYAKVPGSLHYGRSPACSVRIVITSNDNGDIAVDHRFVLVDDEGGKQRAFNPTACDELRFVASATRAFDMRIVVGSDLFQKLHVVAKQCVDAHGI